MKRFSTHVVLGGFLLFVVALFFYSFTQIDLSLTLSRASFLQTVEKAFQSVGYFNRPLSTELFFFIVLGLFFFFVLLIDQIRRKQVSKKQFIVLLTVTTILLMSSYNAFSYDLFNYIFDAKIQTYYHLDPYTHKALDFPTDPMLSFMRWTHRTYPYGPVWLWLSVPLSFAGQHIFTLTLALFKLFIATTYVGSVFLVYKIMQKLHPEHALVAAGVFAFNPLSLIENLVSGHNDIVMLFFLLASLLLLVRKQLIPSFILLAVSIGVKFATVFVLPVFIYIMYLQLRKKHVDWDRMFLIMLFCMLGAVLAATFRSNFQPWYLLYLLPFTALLVTKKYILVPVTVATVASLFTYIPYLYMGNWDSPIPSLLNNFHLTIAGVSLIIFVMLYKQERSITRKD